MAVVLKAVLAVGMTTVHIKGLEKMKIMLAIRSRTMNILERRTPFAFLINIIQDLTSHGLSSLVFFCEDNSSLF